MVYVTFAAALSFAEADPVGGLVTGAGEAGDFDKGLDEDGAVAVVHLPVIGEPLSGQREQPRGQVA